MPIEITIPRLGWSMEEANFVHWLKQNGEPVRSGEPLFTLESEKATQDIEAIDSGILRIRGNGPKAGDVVKVGQVIGDLTGENETEESEEISFVVGNVPIQFGGFPEIGRCFRRNENVCYESDPIEEWTQISI